MTRGTNQRHRYVDFYQNAIQDIAPYTVIATKGSMITAQRGRQKTTRNASFFKLYMGPPVDTTDNSEDKEASSDSET